MILANFRLTWRDAFRSGRAGVVVASLSLLAAAAPTHSQPVLSPEQHDMLLRDMTPEQRQRLWRQLTPEQKGDVIRSLTPEQRAALREQMSPEQRERLRERLREDRGPLDDRERGRDRLRDERERRDVDGSMRSRLTPEERHRLREQIIEAQRARGGNPPYPAPGLDLPRPKDNK
jgi:Spy/CpxP family protein refolding chaperone